MQCIEQNRDFFDRPVCLSPEDRENPLRALVLYFNQFELSDARIHLQQLLYSSICSDCGDFDEASARRDAYWFVKCTEELLEAALLVAETNNKEAGISLINEREISVAEKDDDE